MGSGSETTASSDSDLCTGEKVSILAELHQTPGKVSSFPASHVRTRPRTIVSTTPLPRSTGHRENLQFVVWMRRVWFSSAVATSRMQASDRFNRSSGRLHDDQSKGSQGVI